MSATVDIEYSEWKDKLVIPPLLHTAWHQYFPYNALSPLRRKYIIRGSSAHAPIGCVPLAVAQTLGALSIRFTFPEISSIWSIIGEAPKIYPFSSSFIKNAVAEALAEIAKKTIIWANYHFSFGSPYRALRFIRKVGFPEAKLKWYNVNNTEPLIKMLRDGKPVIMFGLDLPLEGHAWVIDGYIKKYRIKETISEDGHLLRKETETEEYFHCNFGWGGAANGYYPKDSFDTANGPVMRDPKSDIYGGRTVSRNFTAFLHYIDY